MNKKKVVLYIFLTLALICTSVYATISGDINLSASKDSVKSGEEIAVTLKITDVTLADGIDSVEGYINIDENVLEELTVDTIVTENGKVQIGEDLLTVYDSNTNSVLPSKGVFFNASPIRDDGDYRLVISLSEAVPTDTELLTINFKVKDGVQEGTYQNAISYDLFVLFNEDTDKTEKVSESLNVVVEADTNEDINNEVENNVENEVSNDVENKVDNEVENEVKNEVKNEIKNEVKNEIDNKVDNKVVNNAAKNTVKNTITVNQSKDNTISQDRLPDTGYRIIIIPIVLIAILGLVFYSKYNKYNVK